MDRNEFNRTQTIEDIKKTFMQLYEQRGIDQVSVRDICEQANISRTTFYKYFDDKYQILESVEQSMLAGLARINLSLVDAPLRQYRKGDPFPVFHETAQYIHDNGHYFKPLLSTHGDPRFIFRWKKQARLDVKRKFVHDGVAGSDIDVVTELFAAAIVGLYTYWFFENPSLTSRQISEIAGSFLCGSFYNFRS